jgi:hypothetical protein
MEASIRVLEEKVSGKKPVTASKLNGDDVLFTLPPSDDELLKIMARPDDDEVFWKNR